MSPPTSPAAPNEPLATERARRWRLVLGTDAEASSGVSLSGEDSGMDRALQPLYGGCGGGDGAAGSAVTE